MAATVRRGANRSDFEDRLAGLIAAQRPGFSLDQAFYADPEIYRRDLECFLFRHWLCVGHASRIPKPGDYFLFEIAEESVIVVRRADGALGALANVCRHRGSQVCYEREGNAKVFVCPYHGWGYNLDGTLRAARHMPEGFERGAYGLKPLCVELVQGLIFVNFAPTPIGLGNVKAFAAAVAGPYGWADAKLAHRAVYPIAANWKLAVENYLECYHCAPAHPEYAKLHANEQPRWKTAKMTEEVEARGRAMGIEIPIKDRWALDAPAGEEAMLSVRYALYPGTVTGSQDGKAVAPLMGKFADYDGGATFFHIGPASYYLAYCDHGVMYRFTPKAPQACEMEVTWLVRGDAEAGRDYDFDRLTWLWTVTSEEDKLIIEKNQQGVNSRYYEPGPYAPMEPNARRFVEWYLSEIA